MQKNVVKWGLIAAAAGPALIVLGQTAIALSGIMRMAKGATMALGAFTGASSLLAGAKGAEKATSGFRSLLAVVARLGWRGGLVGLALSAAAAATWWAWSPIKGIIEGIADSIGQALHPAIKAIGPLIKATKPWFDSIKGWLADALKPPGPGARATGGAGPRAFSMWFSTTRRTRASSVPAGRGKDPSSSAPKAPIGARGHGKSPSSSAPHASIGA